MPTYSVYAEYSEDYSALSASSDISIDIDIGMDDTVFVDDSGVEYKKINANTDTPTVVVVGYTGISNDYVKILNMYDGIPVTRIESGAFKDNPFIKSLHIPSNIDYISEDAFNNCINLHSITVAKDNINYLSDGSALYKIKDNKPVMLHSYFGIKSSYDILDGTEVIMLLKIF